MACRVESDRPKTLALVYHRQACLFYSRQDARSYRHWWPTPRRGPQMSGSAVEVQAGQDQATGGVVTEVQGQVFLIGLNRPEKRNALTPEMFAELSAIYSRYDKDDSLRCAVLYGEGAVY